jgi:hypothetical protein
VDGGNYVFWRFVNQVCCTKKDKPRSYLKGNTGCFSFCRKWNFVLDQANYNEVTNKRCRPAHMDGKECNYVISYCYLRKKSRLPFGSNLCIKPRLGTVADEPRLGTGSVEILRFRSLTSPPTSEKRTDFRAKTI